MSDWGANVEKHIHTHFKDAFENNLFKIVYECATRM